MQFMGKGKARNFFGKPSQPKPPVWLLCFRIVYSCQGRPGVPIESSALQPPERVEVIYCHLLLPIATACSLAAMDHSPRPVQCMGLADWASVEKVIDQNELRNSYKYYMMTPKGWGGEKGFSETWSERQGVNVRLDGGYLSNPSLHTNIITASQNATTQMVKMGSSVVQG